MDILKHAHSGLRWVFLLIIIFAIVNAFRKWKSGEKFGAKDKLISILAIALTHTQAIIGIILFASINRSIDPANFLKYFHFIK